jgi:hypothetical protein
MTIDEIFETLKGAFYEHYSTDSDKELIQSLYSYYQKNKDLTVKQASLLRNIKENIELAIKDDEPISYYDETRYY